MSNFRRRLMMSIETKTAAKKVYENPTEYYGKSITNYTANGVANWKIFHSDGKNVYIIASDYVDVSKLPAPLTGGSKPTNNNTNYPKAATFNNVLAGYSGSSDITDEKIKALNNDYFNIKKYTSSSKNMKAVAYMLDTKIWSNFKTEKAEYAIGGPTVEMLMVSYSKKYNVDYRARATSATGYVMSNNGGTSWSSYYNKMLNKSDSLYVLPSSKGANAMWLASPSLLNPESLIYVLRGGDVNRNRYDTNYIGFRPLVCLKSDIGLEVDGAGYKIS